jgi:hypothetical protein
MPSCFRGSIAGRIRRRIAVAVVLAALGIAGPVNGAGMAPSEQVLPETTRAWVSAGDFRAARERFERSSYGQLLADPTMKPFLDGLREQVAKKGRNRLASLGVTLEDLEKVPGGEVALAAVEAPGIEGRPGRLCTVLLVDTTGHEAEARTVVDRITKGLVEKMATRVDIKAAPPQLVVYQLPADDKEVGGRPPRQVALALAPTALVVGDDAVQVGQAFQSLAQGRKDCLATNPSFAKVAETCGGKVTAAEAPARWFIDPLRFAKAYQVTNPPREKRKGPDMVAILGRQGFDAIKGAGGTLVFAANGQAIRHHTLIHAPALPGRDPFGPDRFDLGARILRFPDAAGVAPPAWAGGSLAGWTEIQWDIRKAFMSADGLVDDVIGEKGVFKDVVDSIREEPDGPQVDLEADLIGVLGSRVVFLSGHTEPLGTDCERIVIAIESTDPTRLAKTIDKLMKADSDMRRIEVAGHGVWELIDRSHDELQVQVELSGGGVNHADGHEGDDDAAHRRRQRMRQKEERLLPHSTVTVAHGHLLIASHRDILEKVLAPPAGGPLAAAADYRAAATLLDGLLPGKTAVRTFVREEDSLRPSYELLREGSMPKSKSLLGQVLNGALGEAKPGAVREQRLDGETLPPFEAIRRHLGVGCLGLQTTVDGWYVAGAVIPRQGQQPNVAVQPDDPPARQ